MEIVSTCILRDLPVYRVACRSLEKYLPGCELNVITRKPDFQRFRDACGSELRLWDEREFIPGMTLDDLQRIPLSFFPHGAGWYFQQFLKFAFLNVSNSEAHYLIWDADTVLLREIGLFDESGRPFYTKADEYHRPYFETFEALFRDRPNRQFSFISQHQLIDKEVLRRMLAEIEALHPESLNWAWAIMENLRGEGTNLFSEYETYGHFLKLRYPDSFAIRSLQWTRRGGGRLGLSPSPSRLKRLSAHYDFAAFEAGDGLMRRFAKRIRRFSRSISLQKMAK